MSRIRKLESVARELGIDAAWLRERIEAGDVPGIRHADTYLLVPIVTLSHLERLAATHFEVTGHQASSTSLPPLRFSQEGSDV